MYGRDELCELPIPPTLISLHLLALHILNRLFRKLTYHPPNQHKITLGKAPQSQNLPTAFASAHFNILLLALDHAVAGPVFYDYVHVS